MPSKLRPELLRDLRAGLTHHQANRLDQAEALYRKVLKYEPEQPDALNLLGVLTQERGQPARAVQLISQALRAKPRFPEALANLARAQRGAGDPAGALDSARRAVALNPELPAAQEQLARGLFDAGQYAGAAEAGKAAVALAPQSVDARVNLGAALTRLRHWEEAARVYQVAHAMQPTHAGILTDFGVALRELRLYDDALLAHARAVALAPDDMRAHLCHAMSLKRAQDATGAAAACRRAIALSPGNAELWVMLGHNLSALGQFAEAAEAHRKALDLDPGSAQAHRGLVAAGQLLTDAEELQRLAALADDPSRDDGERIAAWFAQGRLYDQVDEYDLAFANYSSANWLIHATREATERRFDGEALARHVDEIIAAWTPATLATMREWGDPSELPVFIVGMPRSGTTLTEQIAASHARVFGAGERHDIGQIIRRLGTHPADPGPASWQRDAVRRETASYVAALRALGGPAERVIDKMPDNVFSVGAIAALFPRARIVLCRRDLRDVCLSCYFQHFTAGLPWANNLTDLALRARQVERLVTHWRAVLPVPMLELHYESLVADLEGESRRLIDFLGLTWDPACLAFHKTERQVLTASVWQVRQPLYSSSVGRWGEVPASFGTSAGRPQRSGASG